jgi:predicted nucleic acid-binding Zn ribbon protein
MSDHADQSDIRIAEAISEGLARVRRSTRLHSDGRCHFCDEPVPHAQLFCDVDCREDFEKEQAARLRAGRQAP